jgi:hypothetical protein
MSPVYTQDERTGGLIARCIDENDIFAIPL